jgi:hypothetical protein
MESNELKNNIMRRVRRIYILRQVLNPLTLKIYALALMGIIASYLVSIPDILRNIPISDLSALYTFGTFSIVHTEVYVQLMVAAALALLLWLMRDIVRSMRGHSYTVQTS